MTQLKGIGLHDLDIMTIVPAYLLVPPGSNSVLPPIATSPHELPLKQLAWEDFERLCLRLVQTRFALGACAIYGVKGQAQKGIDIFARKEDNRFVAYQCKRYQKLTETDLRDLVKLFMLSEWAAKSDEFVICTSASLDSTALQDTFNELFNELKTYDITLVSWDAIHLSQQLKAQPAIVYDFFGAAWASLFNGEVACAQVKTRRKLDNGEVAAYRQQLRAFYTVAFNQFDPGLPSQELNGKPFRLEERFIIPEVYEQRLLDEFRPEPTERSLTPSAEATQQARQEREQDMYTRGQLPQQTEYAGQVMPNAYMHLPVRSRVPVDQKLAQHPRTIVIGEPGAGKSTLLRYLALDLLSDEPELLTLPQALGTRLPVWLPFAYVTRQLSLHENHNLPELLRLWFTSMGKSSLADLVQHAMDDERLLLLIDGVDEWNSLAVARQAIASIEIQANLHSTPIIYSSRPYGFNLLRDSLLNVEQLELAPFSRLQQKDFVQRWFRQWLQAIEPGSLDQAKRQTEGFFSELDKSSDLRLLAENPLLLSILITQKLRDSVLPRNRLKALQDITDYLINRRPAKRLHEAGLGEDIQWEFSLEEVFAELAFHVQQNTNDGALPKQDAVKVAESYLQQQMDYEPGRARKVGRELIELSDNSLGIIIEKSNDEIAFRHRQFQEYLAAKYLNDTSKEQVNEVLQNHGADQAWNQVILTFFARIPGKKSQEFSDYLTQISYTGTEQGKKYYTKLLRYEICLRLPNAPLPMAKEVLRELQHEFEQEQDGAIKQLLLEQLLGAAENPRLKRLVFSYFGTYFPNVFAYGDYRVAALQQMAPEQLSTPQQAFLGNALRNGSTRVQLQASATLGKFIALPAVTALVTGLLEPHTRPDLTAFALNALTNSSADPAMQAAAVAQFASSTTDGMLFFFLLKLKVKLGQQTDQDLANLLASANRLGSELDEELTSLLLEGWPANQDLLAASLQCVGRNWERSHQLRQEVAWQVLLRGYNQETKVIDLLVEELTTHEFPFIGGSRYQNWQLLAHYFKDNSRLVTAVDEWLLKQKYFGPDTAFASLVGRTPVAQDFARAQLPVSSAPHWCVMTLLEGWGDDPQILTELKDYFNGPSKHKDYAAHYVSQLFQDEPKAGVAILEQILFTRSYFFRDRALLPLIQLDRAYFEQHLLTRFLKEELAELSKDMFSQYYSALSTLADHFGADERVKALIFVDTNWQEGFVTDLLIRHYPDATEAVDAIVSTSVPLAASYRRQMIVKLGERYVVDEQSLAYLANFESEADGLLRCEAAVRYFKQAPDKAIVRAVCTRLSFYRGINHEANRQIAFIGFLIIGELTAYFALREGEEAPSPDFMFETGIGQHEPAFMPVLVEYFDSLYQGIAGDFSRIMHRHFHRSEEKMWGTLARYATATSPLIPYLQKFAADHSATIHDPALLSLLAEVTPGSDPMKQIALRLLQSNKEAEFLYAAEVLGQQFTAHADVQAHVANITDPYLEPGKIVAAAIGWPALPILATLFEEFKTRQLDINPHAGYQLKFLFRDVANIDEFLAYLQTQPDEIREQQRFFIKPLLARIRRDKVLQDHLLTSLQSSEHPSVKISFYALLAKATARTAVLAAWKEQQQAHLGSYGYNIVENRVMSLSETVRDVWY